jgi:peptidylprolyl isomerase
VRKIASIAVFGVLLVSISACSTPVVNSALCNTTGNADLVTAAGAFGADPDATFPTPLVSPDLGVTQSITGDGKTVPAGGVVVGTLFIYDAETGDPLVAADQPVLLPTANYAFPFTKVLQCGALGSRVIATGTADELFGDRASQFQIEPEQSLVLVADIMQAFLGRADGADQLAQPGLPAIVTAPDGRPGFTFPDSAAPTELSVDLLKKGSGAKTSAGDTVIVHYSAINWKGQQLKDTTWDTAPVAVVLDESAQGGSLPPDVIASLVGQTVGSQVLIAVPGDQAVVYVIDVLGIAE